MILRNISGGAASLPSINTGTVADGATFDTQAQNNGIPIVFDTKIQASVEVYRAISAGDWVIVEDGVDLTTAQSIKAISSASVGDGDGAVWRIVPETALAKNAPIVLTSTTLALGQGCSVTIKGEIRFKRDGTLTGASLCVVTDVSFVGYWRPVIGKYVLRPTSRVVTDERLRFTADFGGDDAQLSVRFPSSAGTISASLRVCANVSVL